MVKKQQWLEDRRREERRQILERRRQERAEVKAGRRTADRRHEQICFVCRSPFEPKSSGEVVCPQCQIDGVRGGTGAYRKKPRF